MPIYRIDAERLAVEEIFANIREILTVLTNKPKTEAEQEAMRESGRMLATVLDVLVRHLEPGMKSRDLAAMAAAELKPLGAESRPSWALSPISKGPAFSGCHLYFNQRRGSAQHSIGEGVM